MTDGWTDIEKFRAFVPNDDLEERLAEFVEQNNNFNGDDVRAILLRVGRLRVAFALAEADGAALREQLRVEVEVHLAGASKLNGLLGDKVRAAREALDEVRALRETLATTRAKWDFQIKRACAAEAEVQKLRKVLAEAIRVTGPDGGDTARFYQLLEEVMPPDASKTIDELIEDSSFGTPGAKSIRDRTPKDVVDEVMSKIKKGQGEK